MARKKRAWNSSNPLYRWQHRHSGKSARKTKRGGFMARRRGKRSSGGFGGGKKLLPVGGMLGAALLGLGAAAVAKRFLGAPLGQFTGAAAGFLVGGLGGAAGGYVHDNIGNVGGASGTSSGQTVY
jgi:hypothetical protein